jgi:hypothetical protein
LPINLHIV